MERDRALAALREAGCSTKVIEHCLAVERTALSIAKKIAANGHRIDLGLVSLGGLLHDIGRAKTHGIEHGVEGGKILRKLGLVELVPFAERHLGAGIPAEEARALGLPARDFVPLTIEEKVVTYADKLVSGNKRGTYRQAVEWFKSKLGPQHPALSRFKILHEEIKNLMKKKKQPKKA
ncbi:MAG: TIGR00295 family protein [Candidatus Hadarchaeum sp.]|uniref:TIGR00295 family protein n=1 Tax=Candidatus Hadarchaeum sp. TaxID=2883567 RepID=UPI003D14F9B9